MRHATFFLSVLFAAICARVADAARPDTSDVEVDVEIVGEVVRINSSFHIDASPREAWAVMTDYDHAANLISDLEYSRIEARDEHTLYVHQKGQAKHGPLSFSFESMRKIQLIPVERLESHLIRGTTTLLAAEGRGNRNPNH